MIIQTTDTIEVAKIMKLCNICEKCVDELPYATLTANIATDTFSFTDFYICENCYKERLENTLKTSY